MDELRAEHLAEASDEQIIEGFAQLFRARRLLEMELERLTALVENR
ncbi:MAG: hypothetical protein ABR600_00850 [Actinomycetota bacterium]